RRGAGSRTEASSGARASEPPGNSIIAPPSDGALGVDRSWRITWINDVAADHLETSRADAIGASLWDLAPRLTGSAAEPEFRRAMDEGIACEFVQPSTMRSGQWVELRLFPSAEGLAIFLRNITRRMELETRLREREEQLSAVFSQSMAGLAQA